MRRYAVSHSSKLLLETPFGRTVRWREQSLGVGYEADGKKQDTEMGG